MSLSDQLVTLAGADPDILREAPSDRGKYLALGRVILVTSLMAMLSMAFLLNSVFPTSTTARFLAILGVSLFWGAGIMTIDAALVKGMHSKGFSLVCQAIPRFVIAFLISSVVSTPIVLAIFSSDIAQQVHANQIAEANKQTDSVNGGSLATQLNGIQTQIDNNNAIVAGYQKTLNDLNTTLATDQKLEAQAQLTMTCEVEGAGASDPACQGIATDISGPGKNYQVDSVKHDQAVAQVERDKTAVAAAQEQFTAAQVKAGIALCGQIIGPDGTAIPAPACKGGLTADRDNLQTQLDAMKDTSAIMDNNGLIGKLKALSQISSGNGWALFEHWSVVLLLFCIECMPVIARVLYGIEAVSAHDQILKKRSLVECTRSKNADEATLRDIDRSYRKNDAISEHQCSIDIRLAKYKATQEAAVAKKAIKKAAKGGAV